MKKRIVNVMSDEKTAEEMEVAIGSPSIGELAAITGKAVVDTGNRTVAGALLAAVLFPEAPLSISIPPVLVAGGAAAISAVRQRIKEATASEAAAALQRRAQDIESKHRDLEAEGLGGASDLSRIIDDYLAAWESASDARVRELVLNATINRFDPELYKKGLSRRVVETIARLDYGALSLLQELAEQEPAPKKPRDFMDAQSSLRGFWLGLLEGASLVELENPSRGSKRVWITELGWEVLTHMREERELAAVDHDISSGKAT